MNDSPSLSSPEQSLSEQPLVFTQRRTNHTEWSGNDFRLSLTADERTKTRRYVTTDDGQGIYLRLPRGTILRHDDALMSVPDIDALESAEEFTNNQTPIVRIIAKPEAVMIVRGATQLDVMKAAYHLGNRHVSVEVNIDSLRLSPDPVLRHMLEHMGLTVVDEVHPFQPEVGAYHHH
ncbi:MAG: urease accessory protein UreE [Cyanobacteria bacterium J06633_2]